MKKIHFYALAVIASVALWSCGGSNEQKSSSEVVDNTSIATSQDITIESDDRMKFNITEFKVNAGETVTLTLKHVGTMSKEVMGHNVVILDKGVNLSAFAADAIKAKDTDYIPAGYENLIIAYTRIIGGGESDTITFSLTEPGTYEFLCSFPGHSAIMKGTIIAE